MKVSIVVCLFLIISHSSYSQNITGTVTDTLGNGVVNATVTISGLDSVIIAFTKTNDNGYYSLESDGIVKGIIEVSKLGYKKTSRNIISNEYIYNFRIYPHLILLPDVMVVDKRPKLIVRTDTISYDVSDFANVNDRVIGDVLKRMPGIDVDQNGKISYNGKSISRFYIDGDNLLDDKYNIGTKSIPFEMVEKVEILENHEPVKMKRKSSTSTATALNLRIKNEFSGKPVNRMEAGIGISNLYVGSISNISFNKSFKGLNQLTANNTGLKLKDELISHQLFESEKKRGASPISSLLSVAQTQYPLINPYRYTFNNSVLINTNNLVKLKKDLELKSKLSFINDKQKLNYYSQNQIFIQDSNILFTEQLHNVLQPNALSAEVNLIGNNETYYMENTIRFEGFNERQSANLIGSSLAQVQNSHDVLKHLHNELTVSRINSIGFWEFYSYLSNYTSNQKLDIAPFTISDSIPSNRLTKLTQRISSPSFFTNNYLSLNINSKIKQTYKVGASMENKRFNTRLKGILDNYNQDFINDSAINAINWNRAQVTFETSLSYIHPQKRYYVKLFLPIQYQMTRYENKSFRKGQDLSRWLFNPSVASQLYVGRESYFNANYSRISTRSELEEIYMGYILLNYRTLASNDVFNQTDHETFGLGFTFKNSAQMVFLNLNGSYIRQNSNAISHSLINSNYSVTNVSLTSDNISNSLTLSTRLSKYLFALNSVLSLAYSYQENKINQYFNGVMLPYKMGSNSVKIELNSQITPKFSTSYNIAFFRNSSELFNDLNEGPVSKIRHNSHKAEIMWNPKEILFFKLSGEHYYNAIFSDRGINSLFVDTSLKFKLNNLRTDFEIQILNIANIRNYKTYSLQSNTTISSVIPLRGRMALLKASFNL